MSSFVVCPFQRIVCTWYHHNRRSGTPTRRAIAVIKRSSGPAIVTRIKKREGSRCPEESGTKISWYSQYRSRILHSKWTNEGCGAESS